MLGRTVSVDGSYYRMLPNPTLYRWDRRWFDTKRLLLVFERDAMGDETDLVCFVIVLGVVLVHLLLLLEVKVTRRENHDQHRLPKTSQARAIDSRHDLIDAKVLPPLLARDDHSLGLLHVKLARTQEPNARG